MDIYIVLNMHKRVVGAYTTMHGALGRIASLGKTGYKEVSATETTREYGSLTDGRIVGYVHTVSLAGDLSRAVRDAELWEQSRVIVKLRTEIQVEKARNDALERAIKQQKKAQEITLREIMEGQTELFTNKKE